MSPMKAADDATANTKRSAERIGLVEGDHGRGTHQRACGHHRHQGPQGHQQEQGRITDGLLSGLRWDLAHQCGYHPATSGRTSSPWLSRYTETSGASSAACRTNSSPGVWNSCGRTPSIPTGQYVP